MKGTNSCIKLFEHTKWNPLDYNKTDTNNLQSVHQERWKHFGFVELMLRKKHFRDIQSHPKSTQEMQEKAETSEMHKMIVHYH